MRRGSRAEKTSAPAMGRRAQRIRAASTPAPEHPPIVGIGASTGGVEALKSFFAALPRDSGLAIIIAACPEAGDSVPITAALAPHATIPLHEAFDGQPIEANHAYVAPPHHQVLLEHATLRLTSSGDLRDRRGAIDGFFRSLAEQQREKSIGVVLSGAGTEGALGLRAVKAHGGLAVAQTLATAVQPGMPGSAIATGLVDLELPPERIPGALIDYTRLLFQGRQQPGPIAEVQRKGATSVVNVLRARTRCDFSSHNVDTLLQRIGRRMALRRIGNLPEYVGVLETNPREADQLFRDLLVGTTSFLRDAGAFDELSARVLMPLVKQSAGDRPLRVWVAGCATGEEAYSIAILLAELTAGLRLTQRVQIFATDVDEEALNVARAGVYPDSIALDVTPDRLERFFTRVDHHYRISKSVRESVVFAVHDLAVDPPLSRLDLVVCRNVLGRLEAHAQRKLISTFHFALKPVGHLFLGQAEGIGEGDALFASVSDHSRIYSRIGPPKPRARPSTFISWAVVHGSREPRQSEYAFQALIDRELVSQRALGAPRDGARGVATGLTAARTERHDLVQQLEATNQVLTAAHKEVVSANEELQSTNEQLESSREELQSTNKELSTVNAELEDRVRELIALNDDLTNLLAATDIATLLVDADLRVSRFTSAAGRLLNLIPGDVGRPLHHLTSTLIDFDLATQAERVLRTRIGTETAVRGKDGAHYLARVRPCLSDGNAAHGVVVTVLDVTALKATEQELRTSRRYAEVLARLNQEALASTANDVMKRVVAAVADTLGMPFVGAAEHDRTGGRFVLRASTGWKDSSLPVSFAGSPEGMTLSSERTCVFTNLQGDDRFAGDARMANDRLEASVTAVVRHDGEAWGVLAAFAPVARAFSGDEVRFVEAAANTLGTALSRAGADAALRALNETLEQRVKDRTRHLAVMHDITRAVTDAPSWYEGVNAVLQRVCRAEQWQLAYVHLPDKDSPTELVAAIGWFEDPRFHAFDVLCRQHWFRQSETLPGRVYLNGQAVWLNDQPLLASALPCRAEVAGEVGLLSAAALPVFIGSETVAVIELFSDQRHEPTDDVIRLMDDVVVQIGRVIERERVMSQIADLVWAEQQDLLHTLHDSLGQQLTGLGMLSSSLSRQLDKRDPGGANTAAQVAKLAEEALEQVRQLSQGMFPVEVDAEGLALTLRQLKSKTETVSQVRCSVDVDPYAPVPDNRVATELYRIAQEAVTNALKHAHAQLVSIRLDADAGATVLRIADDGVGIHPRGGNHQGMGLHIMRYRATSIGANLFIESGPKGGTVVTCTVRGVPAAARPQPMLRS